VTPPQSPGAPSESLADLGRQAQAGCARALDRLLRQVEGPVYRYLVGRLRAAPDAEDLARDLCQDTLIRAVAAIPRSTFASDGRLLAWGLTIARNVLLDHLRQARGRGEVRGEEHWGRVEAAGLLPGEEPAPPRLLETLAAEALAEVPETTAELLRLRLVGGRTWKEVADVLELTESAAKRRFQRAQAALRRKILARIDAPPAASPQIREDVVTQPHDGAAFRSTDKPFAPGRPRPRTAPGRADEGYTRRSDGAPVRVRRRGGDAAGGGSRRSESSTPET
jgi:RNA polymerase sigma-70 factor (ECF subfamily)